MSVDFMEWKSTPRLSIFAYLFFTIVSLFPIWANAQLLAPNQPEQDACNAIDLCGSTFTSTYSYQGYGAKLELSNTPCGGSESNSVWLRVTIKTAGKLAFLIKPIEIHDDYDFAVLKSDGDCNSINISQVVRCNFNNNMEGSNPNGIVGLSTSSNETSVQTGTTGHSFAKAIDAEVGEVYYVMINNFGYGSQGSPSAGFTIDFSTSTATFANTTIPQLDNIVSSCDYTKRITIHLSNYALCGSIASDGSDFILTNEDKSKTYPIMSASGVNCSGAAGYARDIAIEFQDYLTNGKYLIQAKKGSDGNSILGLCGGETPDNSTALSFSVKIDSLKLVSLDSPACQRMKLIFDQTINCSTIKNDGSQFYVTGPSNVNIVSAQSLAFCQNETTTGILLLLDKTISIDGKYILHSKEDSSLYGSCSSKLYTDINKSFNVNSFNGLVNTLADTTVCGLGDSIQLVTTNTASAPNGGFQYAWTLNNNAISNINELSPWVKILAPTNHYQVETTDQNGCVLRDTTNIRIETFRGSLSPTTASICLNDSLQLQASDNAVRYQWFDESTLKTSANITFSANNIPNPIYHPNAVGQFDYYLLMQSRKQCLDTLTTHIDVKPLPDLQVAFKDTVINYGTDIQLLANGATYYSWTPTISLHSTNTPNPIAHPLVNTTYIVTGTGDNGCHVKDTVQVNIFFQDYAYFPTAFTPNQDGRNDVFRVRFFGKINQFSLNIFNRWGQKIYSSNNPEQGWDGLIDNKAAPSGTYVWQCSYQPDGQKHYDKKGTIVLIR